MTYVPTHADRPPLVSIVVIGLDEGENLHGALRSATREVDRLAGAAEVIYVDSGSVDDSLEIAASYRGVKVESIARQAASAARARNAGLRIARGEYVQFLDGDMELETAWIARATATMSENRASAAVGRIHERRLERTVWNRAFGQDWRVPAADEDRIGGASLWSRDALLTLGGFDETLRFGEDPDLSLRARKAGHRIVGLDRPMVTHDLDLRSFRGYWRRALAVGESRANLAIRHRSRETVTEVLRPIAWLALAVMAIVGLGGLAMAGAFGTAASLATIAALGLGALIARDARRRRLAGVPRTNAIVHAIHGRFVRIPVGLGALLAILRGSARRGNGPVVAYLAPEIPSVSATFVYREILALRREGLRVVPFSIHAVDDRGVSEDGRRFFDEAEVIYASPARVLAGAMRHAVRHPLSSSRTIAIALRDTAVGTTTRRSQRAKIVAQAVAGLFVADRLRSCGATHLHVQFAHAPATVGMYAALAARIPFSVTSHANDLYCEAALLREKVRRARPFVTISHANREFLRGQLGELADRVKIVRCGVDTEELAARDLEDTGAGASLFALGRLVPKKGFDLLLEATAKLAERFPAIEVRIGGDGPERARLETLASDLGIRDRVRFLGTLESDRVLEEFRAASVFVLPCRVDEGGDRDGIPVVLMEAMATGVPVVSTSISGVPELVHHGCTGLLASEPSPAGLSLSIERAMLDHPLRRRMSINGRAIVEREYDVHHNARRLAGYFEEIAA